MSKVLGAEQGIAIVVSPTTAARFVRRMLASANIVSQFLPPHFSCGDPLHILLTLFVAAEERRALVMAALSLSGMLAPHMVHRWIRALSAEDWVVGRGTSVALTDNASSVLGRMVEAIYSEQRLLDR